MWSGAWESRYDTVTTLSSGSIISVVGPEPGIWTIQATGTGDYTIRSQGNSPLELFDFSFVEPSEDIHGGFMPLAGQPLAGSTAKGEAALLGPYSSAGFELVDEAGGLIAPIQLLQNYPQADPAHFLGDIDLPAVPFRVVASGIDQLGEPFRRQYPFVYRAQSVGIAVSGGGGAFVAPGTTTTLDFVITNLGPAGNFVIDVVDSSNFSTLATPALVSIPMGVNANASVDVVVPAGTQGGLDVVVTLTATSELDPTIFNAATEVLTVQDNSPPVCGTGSVVLWPPDHKFDRIDIAAVTGAFDPDGDTIAIDVVAITQDESVNGAGSGGTAPDAVDRGAGLVDVRAERTGGGNGRIYNVVFAVTDDQGASCMGTLVVSVPPNNGAGSTAIDDGQIYDSTASNPLATGSSQNFK